MRDAVSRIFELKVEIERLQMQIKALKEENEALRWRLKEQDKAALRTLEIERDEKCMWMKRAKEARKHGDH